MTEEKKDVLLRQGNPLTESRYKFSNYEKNAFYVVVKQVRRDYVEREPPRTEFENMRVKIPKSALSEIGDEENVLAREVLGAVELGYTRQYGTVFAASVVNGKLQQLAALGHLLADLDMSHSDVELFPFVESDVLLDGLSLLFG